MRETIRENGTGNQSEGEKERKEGRGNELVGYREKSGTSSSILGPE